MSENIHQVNEPAARILEGISSKKVSVDLQSQYNVAPLPTHLGQYVLHRSDDSLWWALKTEKGLCEAVSAYEITEGVSYPQREGKPQSAVVTLIDQTGPRRSVELTAEEYCGNGNAAIAKLRQAGMRFMESGRHLVQRHLLSHKVTCREVLDTPGWYDGGFLTPTGQALLTTTSIGLADTKRIKATPTGNLHAAREGAASIFSGENRTAQAGYLAGLLGPLLDLTGSDSATYMFEGASSTGKSTAQQIAVSHWTPTNVGAGNFISGNTTANALEAPMERSSGTVLAIDENRFRSAAETENIVFMAQQGTGKLRSDRNGSNRRQAKFRTVLLFSAEVGMAQRLAAEGRAPAGGLTVRALSVLSDGVPKPSPMEAEGLAAVTKNYGWTGPAFIQALADQGYVSNPHKWLTEVETLVARLPGTNDSMSARAARLVAYLWSVAIIAQNAGLIDHSFDPSQLAERLWSDHRGSGLAPVDPVIRAIDNLADALVSRRGFDIFELHETRKDDFCLPDRVSRQPVGWLTTYQGERVYVIRAAKLVELAGDFVGDRQLRSALADRGYAVRPPQKKKSVIAFSSWPGLSKAQYFVIRADMIEGARWEETTSERQAEIFKFQPAA